MKTLNHSFKMLLCLFGLTCLVCLVSCGEDEDPLPTVVSLGADINAANGDLVTISLANSSAPVGTTFTLSYAIAAVDQNGIRIDIEDEDGNIYSEFETLLSTDDTNQSFTFKAKENGTYIFQLNAGAGQDQLTVTVSGPIAISNDNLSEHLTLTNQNVDANVVDYLITEVLNVTNETFVMFGEVRIQVAEGAGIVLDNSYMEMTTSPVLEGNDWKGILVKNGSEIKFSGANISNSGLDAFEGYDPALITVEDGGTIGLQGTIMEGDGIGINLMNNAIINSSFIISANLINFEDAIHCNVFQSEMIVGNSTNLAKATATINGMGDTFIATGDNNYSLQLGEMNVYFKGGVTMSDFSIIQVAGGCEILFEENTGLVLSQGGRILSQGSTVTMRGVDDADWKGVLISGNIGSWLQNIEIKGAGAQAHTLSGGIASSVYISGRVDLVEEVTISDGSSFGFYFTNNADIQANSNSLENISFSGMTDAPISGPADIVSDFLLGTNYDFGSDATNPAIKVRSPMNGTGEIIFDPLGGDHFYMIEENLNFISTATLLFIRSGAHLKFDNTSLYVGSGTTGQITIEGSLSDPVILTAADESVGWGGIYLGSSSAITYNIDYANITYGGNTLLTGATEQANLVWNSTMNITCTNSSFTNSKGWGISMESFADFYDFGSVANANSLSGNTSGNISDKTN